MFKPSERLQVLAWLAAVAAGAVAAFCAPSAQPLAQERAPQVSSVPAAASEGVAPDEASVEESEAGMELMQQALARFAPRIDPRALRPVQLRWPATAALPPRLRAGARSCRRPPYCD